MIHSFPFYISDWRDSSARIEFSTGEKLLYLELLFWCWKDGDLPTSEDALCTISGMREREFRTAWPKVKDQFFEQDGRYHHRKVDSRRPELLRWNESRREAGKRGGLNKAIAKTTAKAIAKLELKPSTSTSLSTSIPPVVPPYGGTAAKPPARRKTTSPVRDYAQDFEEFWADYPRKDGKGAAFDAWLKLPAEIKKKAHAGLTGLLPAMLDRIRRKGIDDGCPHASTWLNQGRWDDWRDKQPALAVERPPATNAVNGSMSEAERKAFEASTRPDGTWDVDLFDSLLRSHKSVQD